MRARPISLQGGVPLWRAAWAEAEAEFEFASDVAEAASDAVEDQDDLESCSPSRWP